MDCSEFTILLVDDEPAVLSSLKRLMRPLKCTLYTAESAVLGIAVLEQHPIDLVISDMRMPEISGDQFLAEVAERWPTTERVVMTGYADTQAAIDAINNGRISRFMSKPWDDTDVINVVQKSFELIDLRRTNERLVRDNADKQQRLERLNQSLEKTIEQRTLQLQQNHAKLINSYRSTVRMFSALIARRLGQNAKQGVSLNKLFLAVVNLADVDKKELKQLYYAWQLRNLGKLSFDDDLLKPAYTELAPIQQRRFHQHPLLAHASISLVEPLYGAGEIIRQHKEYLDGSGYPNGLRGEAIAPAAQLLCVVNDFVELTNGRYQTQAMSTVAALEYMRGNARERYNSEDVERLSVALEALSKEGEALHDRIIRSPEMVEGMTLSRDLLTSQGVLLLSAGQVLDNLTIQRMIDMEINLAEILKIYIDQ